MARDDEIQQQGTGDFSISTGQLDTGPAGTGQTDTGQLDTVQLDTVQLDPSQTGAPPESPDSGAPEQTLDELMDLTYSGERQEQALADQALQAKVTAPHKILVVGASWVGDMLMAQSLFILLKRTRPDCHITVLAPAWTRPLLERMPEVDESLVLPFDHGELKLGARRRFGKSLANAGYTHAIVLPNS
ncbi:MAG: hypothetical protein MUQ61_01345, partial [OM182 bacterium]|nr:hypothetical protein [OM182 bacterium]